MSEFADGDDMAVEGLRQDQAEFVMDRRTLFKVMGFSGVALTGGCGVYDDVDDHAGYRDRFARNAPDVPQYKTFRNELQYAADAEQADSRTRPYAQRLQARIASRYDSNPYVDNGSQAGTIRWQRAAEASSPVRYSMEWKAGLLTMKAAARIVSPRPEDQLPDGQDIRSLSLSYLVPNFTVDRRRIQTILTDETTRFYKVAYQDGVDAGLVQVNREGNTVNGKVSTTVTQGIDPAVIDNGERVRLIADKIDPIASRLNLV